MEKDLENLFNTLNGSFDTEEPQEGHTVRFLEKLESLGNHDTIGVTEKKQNLWLRPLAIAASIAIIFSLGVIIQKNMPSTQEQLAEISPEAANTEFYFASIIEEQVKTLQQENIPETQQMVDDTMDQLQKLQIDYSRLEKDLLAGGNGKMILRAMITNFQTRIDLLEEVLVKIENIKNIKQSNNENYTI